jgi:hypothetical protein
MWSPGAKERILMENMSFCRFSIAYTAKNSQGQLAEFWFLADFSELALTKNTFVSPVAPEIRLDLSESQ